jgi:hypothetical protein
MEPEDDGTAYRLTNIETGVATTATLQEVATAMQLDPWSVVAAIEEYGECSTDTHIAVIAE